MANGTAKTKSARLTKSSFSDRALRIVKKRWPDAELVRASGKAFIVVEGSRISLDNLYKSVRANALSGRALTKHIEDHFERATRPVDEFRSWEDVRALLRPQLMPRDFIAESPDVLSQDFVPGVQTAFVIDQPGRYVYVLRDDLKRWNISPAQLDEAALNNFAAANKGLELEWRDSGESDGAGLWTAITESDGYAAARILLPSVRQEAFEVLGKDFCFAIPNRDFLILWSKDFSNHELFAANVRQDHEENDHPLSPEYFLASSVFGSLYEQ